MIDRKHHRIVFSFFMAFAFVVAFPTIFLVSPMVHKLVSLVLKEES